MRRTGVVAIVAAFALAACGGSTTTKTVTTAAQSSGQPVTSTATTTASSAGPVYFQGVAGPPGQRPATLELTGDGTLFVSNVQWTSWGGTTAAGSGNAQYHGCTPDCAQATPHTALVAVRLSGIRTCGGRAYYASLRLTLSSGQLLDEPFVQRSWSPC